VLREGPGGVSVRIVPNVQLVTANMLLPNMRRRCARVENRAKLLVSGPLLKVRTGRLRSSIRSVVGLSRTGSGVDVVGRVGTNVKYGGMLHRGTGLYGPRHRRIVPIRAKYLRYKDQNGRIIFRRSVAGVRPRPFVRQALRDTAGGNHP
jgi:hypothetical protein